MGEEKMIGAVEMERMRQIGFAQRAQDAAEFLTRLGEIEGADFVMADNLYGGSKGVEIRPDKGIEAKTLALVVLGRLPAIGAPPSRATKTFDKSTGTITYEIPGPDGWTIKITGGEARCKVKKVIETELVPAREAYTAVRERFVIENPEECGAAVEA